MYQWIESAGLSAFPEARKGTKGFSSEDFNCRLEGKISYYLSDDEIKEIIDKMKDSEVVEKFKEFFSDFKYWENRECVRVFFLCFSWRVFTTYGFVEYNMPMLKRVLYFRKLNGIVPIDKEEDCACKLIR